MTAYFITRHPGAADWARQQGLAVDVVLEHFDTTAVRPGDTVIGTLPVNLAAEVCARGGRYLHLSIRLPVDKRGRELSAADLQALGARVEEYLIQRRETP